MLAKPVPTMKRAMAGSVLIGALLLSGGYAAWAAQPAQPSTSTVPAGKIVADIALRIDDGEPVRMRALADAGVPFSVDADHDGKHYVVASTVDRWQVKGRQVLRMKMRITEDGKLLTEPGIAVENGKSAQVHVGEEITGETGSTSFKGVRLDIVLTDSMPVVVEVPKQAPLRMQSGSVDNASRIANPPGYPVDVQKEGVTGPVVLIFDVAADGSVIRGKVERSSGDARLDAAALSAANKWKFRPEVKDGKPVQSQVRVPVDFRMEEKSQAPTTTRQAMASRPANFNTYERMLTSISSSWTPPKLPQDAC